MKALRIFSVILNVMLGALYLVFGFAITMMYPVFPWFSEDQSYMLYMFGLWLPICIVTILYVLTVILRKRFDKLTVGIACLNAIYIPLVFALGFVDVKLLTIRIIGGCALTTMVVFYILVICEFVKNKKEAVKIND